MNPKMDKILELYSIFSLEKIYIIVSEKMNVTIAIKIVVINPSLKYLEIYFL